MHQAELSTALKEGGSLQKTSSPSWWRIGAAFCQAYGFCVLSVVFLTIIILQSNIWSSASASGFVGIYSPSTEIAGTNNRTTDPDECFLKSDILLKAEQAFQRKQASRATLFPYLNCSSGRRWHGWQCGLPIASEILTGPTYHCFWEQNVGPFAEGGKWLCSIPGFITNSSIVYSIGSHGDAGFEAAMYSTFGVVSHTFDPTLTPSMSNAVTGKKFLNFYNIGLSVTNNYQIASKGFKFLAPGAQFMTVEKMMTTLNHTHVDIFKIDCEGCEVAFMAYIAKFYDRTNVPFKMILMEIHTLRSLEDTMTLLNAFDPLGYRVYHSEYNLLTKVACCMEIALIHESVVVPK